MSPPSLVCVYVFGIWYVILRWSIIAFCRWDLDFVTNITGVCILFLCHLVLSSCRFLQVEFQVLSPRSPVHVYNIVFGLGFAIFVDQLSLSAGAFNFVSPQSSVCVLFYGFSSVVWAAFPQARFRCCHHYIWPLFVSYGLCAVMSPMKGIGRYCPNVECVWMFTRAPL